MFIEVAVFGIHFGSSSVRAFLYSIDAIHGVDMGNTNWCNDVIRRSMPGDFLSYGYLFESQRQVYLEDNSAIHWLGVSLKFGMYLLANMKDKFVKHIPSSES